MKSVEIPSDVADRLKPYQARTSDIEHRISDIGYRAPDNA